jgi:hypothetical protein
MELLESVGPRPRQARYQAALRPDMVEGFILAYFMNLRPLPMDGGSTEFKSSLKT